MNRLYLPKCLTALTIVFVVSSAMAQEQTTEEECLPHEVDMGEYCVSAAQKDNEEVLPGRKATPFRRQGMMPGGVKTAVKKPEEKKAPLPQVVVSHNLPAPVVAQGGFGIQLGAFSSRESAISVASSVISAGTPVLLSPIERGNKVLWACVAGPYAQADDAREDLGKIKADSRFAGAYIKPLNGMKLEGISHDSLEK